MTDFRKKALAWIADQNKKKAAEKKAGQREIVNGVDITDVPQQIRDVIRSMNNDKSSKVSPDGDYIALIRQYRDQHKCTLEKAIIEVNRRVPMAREAFIEKANKPTMDQMPIAYVGDLDPLDFKKTVREYRRKFNCSYQQALKMIDQDHPGYRAEYIRAINKI